MRVKLPYLILGLLALTPFALRAQYQQMPIASGLNADVIANGTGTVISSTNADIDGVNYNYVATDYKLTASSTPITYGVPVTGLINSIAAATPGLSFQLASLSANNSLRLATATPSEIVFTTPLAATRVFMLATTGSGAGTVSALITFTDNTTQSLTGLSVPDWYGGTNPAPAILGIGRINRTTNALEPNVNDPRMYQVPLNINAANQSKLIQKIQITKTSTGGGVVNVFAFSAEVTPTCPSPTVITSTSTATSGTVSWTAPSSVPAMGYDYYISTSATVPAASATPTGNTSSTTVTFPGLPTGVQQYVWIRSKCSNTDKGTWQQTTFTTGQMSVTYTAGDLPTLYDNGVTITSTTVCPATMSINVPAGYQIASTSVAYRMTAQGGAFMSEARTFLRCITTGLGETQLYQGTGNGGTFTYNRTGLNIANGAAGTVQFEMRAWRVWGGADCNTTYNKIDNNTWVITVTYAPIPCTTPIAAPTAVNQVACNGSTVAELQATAVPGAIVSWFTVPTAGTALATTTPVTAGTYYVSQGYGGAACESPRVPVEVTISTVAPPSAAPVTGCQGATVAEIQPTGLPGATFKCYSALTGGTQLDPTTPLTNGTYFVSQTVNGCESLRTQVTVTLTTITPPTAAAQTICSTATLNDIVVTGVTGTKKWYAAATGGSELNSGTFIAATSYYVSQVVDGCESLRTQAALTINTLPAPTVLSQTFCSGATAAELSATGVAGATIKWFAAGALTTPLEPTAVLTSGQYYASQNLNGCESPLIQSVVTISIIPVPATAATQSVCDSGVVSDLTATPSTGGTLHWYDEATGGTALEPTTALATGSYFVSQTIGNCESNRVEVAVLLNGSAGPAAPAQGVCPGSTISDLEATGTPGATYNWYEEATGGDALPETAIVTAGSYFVSQSINGCESLRTEVAVTVNAMPVPETNTAQLVCSGSTIDNLFATPLEGASINWYEGPNDENALTDTYTLTPGSYFVSQTSLGCESARVEVTVTVGIIQVPGTENTFELCEGSTVADLFAAPDEDATINWYLGNINGDPLALDTPLVNGVYYATQTLNGCESLGNDTTVTLTPAPAAPTGSAQQDFTSGDTVNSLQIAVLIGAQINWYVMNDNDELVSVDPQDLLTDDTTYFVTQTMNTCESATLEILANNTLKVDTFTNSTVKVYPNPVDNMLNITAGNDVISDITIVNLLGQKVLSEKGNAASMQINVSGLQQGNYFLQVFFESGKTISTKIIKQ